MKPSEIVRDLPKLVNEYVMTIEAQNLLKQAANLIESLIPKPIEEAPRDEFILGAFLEKGGINVCYGVSTAPIGFEQYSLCNTDDSEFTHFIPLSSIQKLME